MPRRPDPIPTEASLAKVFRAAKREGVRVQVEIMRPSGETIIITTMESGAEPAKPNIELLTPIVL
jgi:hypothetical protein